MDCSDAESCEGPLTEKECLDALKNMDRAKTPGSDGLPAECYQIFWKDTTIHYCIFNANRCT